jgi:hypothetical protein
VLIMVVMMIAIMMVAIAISAAPLYLFQLFAPLVSLPAVLAMPVDGIAQFVFGLMNLTFAGFMPVIVSAHRNRRAYKTDNRQQHNRKNLEDTSHGFSFGNGSVRLDSRGKGLRASAPRRNFAFTQDGVLDASLRVAVASDSQVRQHGGRTKRPSAKSAIARFRSA